MTPLNQNERIARLQLARSEGIGPVTFRRLLERYGTAERAAKAIPDLAAKGGRKKPLKLCPLRDAQDEITKLEKLGGQLVVFGDEDYPAQLAAIEDAPMVLSVLGNVSLLKKTGIGIVGSRNASLQGRRFAENIAADLGRADICVISGLARGIDTAAHTASLSSGTIAVVAGGVDVIYPAENKSLYEQITARGAIVAENALGTQPTAQHFPRRNRIISGLSAGVVIVEGTLKSGSLITAHVAADQGREVFAVPGHPMDPRASGPNALIRDGATLISSGKDILDALVRLRDLRVREPDTPPMDYATFEPDEQVLTHARRAIAPLLSSMPVAVDALIRETGLPTPVVQTVLLELELAGNLTRHPQNRVSALISGAADDTYIEYEMDKSASLL